MKNKFLIAVLAAGIFFTQKSKGLSFSSSDGDRFQEQNSDLISEIETEKNQKSDSVLDPISKLFFKQTLIPSGDNVLSFTTTNIPSKKTHSSVKEFDILDKKNKEDTQKKVSQEQLMNLIFKLMSFPEKLLKEKDFALNPEKISTKIETSSQEIPHKVAANFGTILEKELDKVNVPPEEDFEQESTKAGTSSGAGLEEELDKIDVSSGTDFEQKSSKVGTSYGTDLEEKSDAGNPNTETDSNETQNKDCSKCKATKRFPILFKKIFSSPIHAFINEEPKKDISSTSLEDRLDRLETQYRRLAEYLLNSHHR
ncbi:hypothetical protein [Holospora undulata]|uniref:Uncharacterized protein n=1 Tax=Holospora undulata HU1 TaxID=1321371 RepID=A0A061JG05_9PROT|nr:hypothetical protein [Holospora undulata]ETZ04746.1 hypothetical protein K737_300838 [Holospora undulata HU1]